MVETNRGGERVREETKDIEAVENLNLAREKILTLLELYTGRDKETYTVEVKDSKAKITSEVELPEKFREVLEKDIKKHVKMKEVAFSQKESKKKKEKKTE